jgi:acetyl esterase/lipase
MMASNDQDGGGELSKTPEMEIEMLDLEYAVHDGVSLRADLYRPKGGSEPLPVLVAVHGGGWERGDRKSFRNWGHYLPRHGYAVLAIQYRMAKPGAPMFPQALHDVRAAVQYARVHAADLCIEPDRIGLFGLSAGGHLAALAALAGDHPRFSPAYPDDRQFGTSAAVKAAVIGYGIFDAAAHWDADLSGRPGQSTIERFLGASLLDDREVYFQASPLSYVTRVSNRTAFQIIYGLEDEVADPQRQSKPFARALGQAGFFVRTLAVPGAGHFWLSDPLEEAGSLTGSMAPKLVRFLREKL